MSLQKIRSPILFQWNNTDNNYFEGWYYKQVVQDERTALSLIPGISIADDDFHCFIQYIYIDLEEADKKNIKTGYLKYSFDKFVSIENPFTIRIENNVFTESKITVNLADQDIYIKGTLELGSFRTIKKSIITPNIMGLFAYFPKMECYHGIVSMNHTLQGSFKINDKEVEFSSGKGYIEKDWGTSFPKKYIWIQCNNFKNEDVSLSCSIANIPVLKKCFLGFICCLVIGNVEYRFATYNNSIFKIECLSDEKISLVFENKNSELKIEVKPTSTGALFAPHKGKMQKVVKEGLSGKVEIYLLNKRERIAYRDAGNMAGVEVFGM